MDFVVDMTLPAGIVIGATGLTGLAQEIRTVLATRKGSVPLDRDFGVDWSFVDAPLPDVPPRFVAEVARQIEKYVPRIRVLEVTFKSTASNAAEGKLFPIVKVAIRPEYFDDFF